MRRIVTMLLIFEWATAVSGSTLISNYGGRYRCSNRL